MKAIAILASVVVALLPTARALTQSPALAERSYFSYGTGIGLTGFRVSTANGVAEIMVPCGSTGFGTGSRYWMLHAYDAGTQTYQQVFVSPVYPSADAIARTAVADLLPATGPELIVATRNGTIEIWNQATRSLEVSFNSGLTQVNSVVAGDADGDGAPDLLVCNANSLRALDVAGVTLWTAGFGGVDLTIGQMDADVALEVALTSGHIVDCGTHQSQWYWQNQFGIDVECDDLDGDGRDELVAAEDWGWVWAFDIDTQLPKWSLAITDIACIAIADVDADANLEILIGEGQWGDVLVYDSTTQLLDYSINNPEHGVTSIAVGDVDGDSQPEVVFGAGWTSTGPDYWYVASTVNQAHEWSSPTLGGDWIGPQLGDIDGDGNQELVCMVRTLGYNGPHIVVFDAATLDLEHISPSVSSSSSGSQPYDLVLFDIDSDGDDEVFFTNGGVMAFDWNGTAFTQVWQLTYSYSGPSYRQIAIADLDGNNTFEVVLGGSQYLHVFPYGSSIELWHSFYLGGEVEDVVIGNSDLTPGLEMHALSSDGNIYIFDGATRVARAILQDGGIDRTAITIAEGADVLLAGDINGSVFGLPHDGTAYLPIGPLPMASSEIHSLKWVPLLNFLIIGSDERIAMHTWLQPFWYTANYGTGFGRTVALDLYHGQIAATGPFGISLFLP